MPTADVAGPLAKCAKGGGQRSCAGLESSIFYPPTEEESGRAKAVCAECPVRQDCLEFAISVREKEGVWGGPRLSGLSRSRPALRPGPVPAAPGTAGPRYAR
ncbi:MAG: WhiB family transcriptional regulator [Candidatus Microthrix sp.]|uniref:WhiB family transcriptional regulator n=2 Tax=Candidatus Neomicrothrix sp. TaxID=2719034 RepID=UPI0025C009B0|nr:WhiB family transcriptional regulator [Candidatus Microthrix sp.]MBL0202903.1 WhiB family transcriptional regulator [Candidatus Microthrix sp.]